MTPNGLEPLTPSLKVRCSNQLSYGVIINLFLSNKDNHFIVQISLQLWDLMESNHFLWIFSPTYAPAIRKPQLVGVDGLEPPNPKESIYSAPQLPLCDTPNLVFSLPLNNHIASPMLLSDAYHISME